MSSATLEAADDSVALSQTVRTQLRLRELVVGGELKPGARIAELALVERLGASRTPIRMALVRLQEEGLLEALPNGGFAVKDFSENDIHDAIELRGTLEGLAARLAAERGVPGVLLAEARDCIEQIDQLLAAPSLSEASFGGYVQHNGRFHELLAEMAGSDMVQRQLERAKTHALRLAQRLRAGTRHRRRRTRHAGGGPGAAPRRARRHPGREGARAESLMREHARIAHANLRQAMADHRTWLQVPGAGLVRRRNSR